VGQALERANALECAGAWEAAAAIYQRLFQDTLTASNSSGIVDALYGQTRAYDALGRYEEAEELAGLCGEIAERSGSLRMSARALNLFAVIRFRRGDLDGAAAAYTRAVERARDIGDDELVGFASQNLGVIANIRGDLKEARLLYLESVGASVRSGDRMSAAMVYNNLGMVCTDLGEHLQAEMYFDRGIEIAERIADVPMQARLYANRAEPMIRTGDPARARETLDVAESLVAPLQVPSTAADIERFRAMLARGAGDLDEAERRLERSIRIAREAGISLAHAEALEELALVRRERGQPHDADAVLTEARDIYLAIGAVRDAERVLSLHSD
jgi:tetratricopeptide (TPR) repeat protein